MKSHINADFFKLLLVFLIIGISLNISTANASIVHYNSVEDSTPLFSEFRTTSSTSLSSSQPEEETESTVPVPAAAWLFASGLLALFRVAKGRKKRAQFHKETLQSKTVES